MWCLCRIKHIFGLEQILSMRDVKTDVVHDQTDDAKQRKLPQHDFSIPQVHVTPSSFRFMAGHHKAISEKKHTVSDLKQSVVTIRPKFYIGNSGSVWGSDFMLLRWGFPQLFEIPDGLYKYCSVSCQRFCAHVHDCMFYFEDTTVVEDVMSLTPSPDCKFRAYEVAGLTWFEKQLNDACFRWEEDKVLMGTENTTDIACWHEIKMKILSILESLKNEFNEMVSITSTDFKIIGNS